MVYDIKTTYKPYVRKKTIKLKYRKSIAKLHVNYMFLDQKWFFKKKEKNDK